MSAPSNLNAIPDYAVLPDLPLGDDERAELTGNVWDQLVTGNGDVEEFLDVFAEDFELSEEQLVSSEMTADFAWSLNCPACQ
ncbi:MULTISPECIES: hypothetical protein [unclassified Mycolicibacterium]|uniref:hypothetical protein n=1 Tax=unclassified Mycolicibacterium TaxID=2636767 RepID=UPI0012DF3DCC|nr:MULTISPECIES: hypothetical protein [unclassified Mycolicibacterium]MUL80708.1 hypothetical protein [Mycolicibacterium sp. CBMA 329]MUL86475.1 hypothetical protein [Mycolicibacterium sp. CBMA 331]MUM01337.1 hypothetical protein [Mycolicibacterium sp. CBMA 334]MUM25847.1 hypothetical protein [Mycolicibacterium sp. CBMA 295]MUM36771.1 hypothetical protein [Mycolicibacterium sp. CBMA 247]